MGWPEIARNCGCEDVLEGGCGRMSSAQIGWVTLIIWPIFLEK